MHAVRFFLPLSASVLVIMGGCRVEKPLSPEASVHVEELLSKADLGSAMPRTKMLKVTLEDRRLEALRVQPPFHADLKTYPHGEHRVCFPGTVLGMRPVFSSALALLPAGGKSDGVTFMVAVDGEIVAKRTVKGSQVGRWIDWRVPLSAYAGRKVDLELRVAPGKTRSYDVACWGKPVLESQ